MRRRALATAALSPAKRGHLGANLVDQRLAADRLAFGHPQQVVAFVVLNQQIAQVLTGGEDLQQHRQRLAVALEERADRQRAAGRGHETVEIVQRPVGIAGGGQMLGQLVGEIGQQVERQADGGHVHQVGVCSLGIDDSQGAEPRRGFRLIVEVASQLVDLHAANAPSQNSPARPEKETALEAMNSRLLAAGPHRRRSACLRSTYTLPAEAKKNQRLSAYTSGPTCWVTTAPNSVKALAS